MDIQSIRVRCALGMVVGLGVLVLGCRKESEAAPDAAAATPAAAV